MRTLTFGISVGGETFRASVSLTDSYFDDKGRPRWNLLNARFSSPVILWDTHPIGAVPVDDPVVDQPPQIPTIGDELRKLREVVDSLEKKFSEVR